MFTWGAVSLYMAFITTEWQFYLCRFLLGASEASLYPVIYFLLFPRWFTTSERARATSLMLTSLLLSTIIGAPIAGVLLEHSFFGLLGWPELFILESIPALCFAFYFFFAVKDRPDQASWLTDAEKEYLTTMYQEEQAKMQSVKKYTVFQAFTDTKVLKLYLIYFLWLLPLGRRFLGLLLLDAYGPQEPLRLVHLAHRRSYRYSYDGSPRRPACHRPYGYGYRR